MVRSLALLFVRRLLGVLGGGPSPAPTRWRSRCCGINWRSCTAPARPRYTPMDRDVAGVAGEAATARRWGRVPGHHPVDAAAVASRVCGPPLALTTRPALPAGGLDHDVVEPVLRLDHRR